MFRELEMPFSLATTLLDHGEPTGGEARVTEAREIFERLDATPGSSVPASRRRRKRLR